MYTELTTLEEAKGKTVQSMTYALLSDQMIIAFTDQTFVCFGVERGYDDDSVFRQALRIEDFGREDLVASGIISQGELQQRIEDGNEARCRAREYAERRRYEELRAKFEGGQS